MRKDEEFIEKEKFEEISQLRNIIDRMHNNE